VVGYNANRIPTSNLASIVSRRIIMDNTPELLVGTPDQLNMKKTRNRPKIQIIYPGAAAGGW